jgi:hypothetical protein
VRSLRAHHGQADPEFLTWLTALSAQLAEIRAPAFYQEIQVSEADARTVAEGADRVLAFGRELIARLGRRSG